MSVDRSDWPRTDCRHTVFSSEVSCVQGSLVSFFLPTWTGLNVEQSVDSCANQTVARVSNSYIQCTLLAVHCIVVCMLMDSQHHLMQATAALHVDDTEGTIILLLAVDSFCK